MSQTLFDFTIVQYSWISLIILKRENPNMGNWIYQQPFFIKQTGKDGQKPNLFVSKSQYTFIGKLLWLSSIPWWALCKTKCGKRKTGKVSKFGKREIPVCVIGAIKSKCGFLDFQPGWPCKILGKTVYGTYQIQSGIKAKSTLGKIILNPWLENIGFPHNFHAISIYISSLEISQFFQWFPCSTFMLHMAYVCT